MPQWKYLYLEIVEYVEQDVHVFKIFRWDVSDIHTANLRNLLIEVKTTEKKTLQQCVLEFRAQLTGLIRRMGIEGWEMFQVMIEPIHDIHNKFYYFKQVVNDEPVIPLPVVEKPKRTRKPKAGKTEQH